MIYTVTCRGSLITSKGPIPTGGTVEMSEKDAASLPPGTVTPIKPTGDFSESKPTPKTPAPAAKEKSK